MTNEAETTAPETAAEEDAARAAEQLAADADRDRLAREVEAARLVAEEKARRVLAMFDRSGVLVGRNDTPSDEEWDAAQERQRFPNGFDNAVGRYKIAEYEPGRFRFEPIPHDRDKPAENHEPAASIMAPIARLLLNARGRRVYRDGEADADLDALAAFLNTFDGA